MRELYDSQYWPFVVLVFCIGLIVAQITWLKIHAFLALIIAALAAGLLTHVGKLPALASKPGLSHWALAVELTSAEFGNTAGGIGISIGLASIISVCLMESGAADKVVRRFIAMAGPTRVGIALLASTYVLSIPIFFDTMFMLMVPLAKALRIRSGKDYLLYILAICCGGVITHSMTVPHPGPIYMVDNLKIDVGLSIQAGVLVGIFPAIAGWFVCRWLNKRLDIPLRDAPGATRQELEAVLNRTEAQLPGFVISILPVVLPIFLISLNSLFKVLNSSALQAGQALPVPLSAVHAMDFIGNKNIALLFGSAIGVYLLVKQCKLNLSQIGDKLGPPLETAGVIILITSAGGAFGLMLKNAGVGGAIQELCKGHAVNLILLSYVVAVVIRVAQGSATVAMQATSAMLYPMISAPGALGCHPVYIFLSIGFGAICCSWMNDSGFWVVSKLSGMTERETLKTWSVLLTCISITGFLATLALSAVLPMQPK